jgi:hypothetical protein
MQRHLGGSTPRQQRAQRRIEARACVRMGLGEGGL